MSIHQKAYSGWAYIAQAPDVPGSWVAHCPDFDVMSLGDSPEHALDMVREAVELTIEDDLRNGFDPCLRVADPEDWTPLLRLFERHTKVPVNGMNATAFKEFAAPLTVVPNSQGVEIGAHLHDGAVVTAA